MMGACATIGACYARNRRSHSSILSACALAALAAAHVCLCCKASEAWQLPRPLSTACILCMHSRSRLSPSTACCGCRGAALSLSRIQDYVGDEEFGKLLGGSDRALLCAMKSIPTYSVEASELPDSKQVLRLLPFPACMLAVVPTFRLGCLLAFSPHPMRRTCSGIMRSELYEIRYYAQRAATESCTREQSCCAAGVARREGNA
jgi:hypothetical protein